MAITDKQFTTIINEVLRPALDKLNDAGIAVIAFTSTANAGDVISSILKEDGLASKGSAHFQGNKIGQIICAQNLLHDEDFLEVASMGAELGLAHDSRIEINENPRPEQDPTKN